MTNKSVKKQIKNSKFNRHEPKVVEVTPGKALLLQTLDKYMTELKQITAYGTALRANIKIIKELIKEVK